MRRRGGIDAILALLRYLSSAPAAKSARDQQKGPTCAVAYKIRNSQVALNLALASVVGDWPYCRRLQSLLGSTRGAKRAAKNLTVFVARTTQWRAPMTRRRWSVDATTQIDMLKVQIADGAKRIEHQRTIQTKRRNFSANWSRYNPTILINWHAYRTAIETKPDERPQFRNFDHSSSPAHPGRH